jgi:ribose 1,5-bisphosphokinase
VLVNGSRAHLAEALSRYHTLLPVLLTVREEVLRERLLRRGREGEAEIEARVHRNELFSAEHSFGETPLRLLDNSGDFSATVVTLLKLITLSATPDQT